MPCVSSTYELLKKEYHEAIKRLNRAIHFYQYAAPEFFEVANNEITTAQSYVDVLGIELRKYKTY